ncbi:MAG: metallophosphoesterase [Deltaproteobacteria bacterium]
MRPGRALGLLCWLPCWLPGVAACTRPSAERARQDAQIGQAESEELRVEVAGGHAVVRELSSGYVSLWASAPRLELQLGYRAPPPAELWLEVANCMPQAELSRVPAVPLLASERDAGGVCRFQLAPPAELRELALTLGPPDSGRPSRFRFAVLSDVQEAIGRVQDIFTRLNQLSEGAPGIDFLLGAGDLTSQGTGEELGRFQAELLGLRIPYYTTLGNHELGQNPTLFHEYFGRGSQSFDYRGVRFSLIDSASATVDPIVFDWLDEWLQPSASALHVVAMHIPPLDPIGVRNGAFASRSEAAKLLARLAEGGVDLTLYGHIHSYYHFQNAGIPAYISGGGGSIPERFDQMGRHFLVVDADPEARSLEVRVVRVD